MTINAVKLANALKLQERPITMDDKLNRIHGTDFMHRALVRKVKELYKRPVTASEIANYLQKVA